MLPEQYPQREKYFANRFCRTLTKSAAANELGPEVCWLLTVVAHQEDAKRYKGPVTYYNDQLAPLAGCGGRARLVRARDKAIKAGWLHYEQGGKGIPGKYWVLVPENYADLSDGPCDESDAVPNQNDKRDSNGACRSESEHQVERQTDSKRTLSGTASAHLPNLSLSLPLREPSPNGDSVPSKKKHAYSREFERWYQAYPLKTGKAAAAKAYARAAKEVGHDVLLEAVRIFAASDKAQGDFCWHPATWLNQGHWEDDPATWKYRSSDGDARAAQDESFVEAQRRIARTRAEYIKPCRRT